MVNTLFQNDKTSSKKPWSQELSNLKVLQWRLWMWFLLLYWVIHSSDEMFQKVFVWFTCLCIVDISVQTCLLHNCVNFPLSQLLHQLSKGEESKGFLHTWVFGETTRVGTNSRTWIYFSLAPTFTTWLASWIKIY